MTSLKAITSYTGKALCISALFMFISAAVSVIYDFDEGFAPLVISGVITLTTGLFPLIFVKDAKSISISDGYIIIVLSWFLSFLFGMLPYLLYGGEFTPVNAWFESVSGYTTTGSTILTDIESLPKSLLFWRSSTHYIGGLGVIVLLLVIIPDNSSFKYRLSNIEISTISKEGYPFRSGKVVRVMVGVYICLTITETILLNLAGMSFFDALNHTFSTVATGGFSTKNNSIMYYDSALIDIILMVFMTLSSMHFGIIYAACARRSFRPMLKEVPRYYLGIIFILSIGTAVSLIAGGTYDSWGKAALDSGFQVISFISTTGFGNADNALWPMTANILLIFAAFHCGCSGSTTGGVKADRMLLSLKAIWNELKHRLSPSSITRTRIDGNIIKEETISAAILYIVAYLIVLFISFTLLLICGIDITDAFSGTVASLGNVGPGLGDIGTMGNFSSFPNPAKVLFTFDMFLGRVEIFPILALMYRLGNKRG